MNPDILGEIVETLLCPPDMRGQATTAIPQPKPRFRFLDHWQAVCGWCGEWDTLDNLRYSTFTGNDWPIHPGCLVEWYDGGPRMCGHSQSNQPG